MDGSSSGWPILRAPNCPSYSLPAVNGPARRPWRVGEGTVFSVSRSMFRSCWQPSARHCWHQIAANDVMTAAIPRPSHAQCVTSSRAEANAFTIARPECEREATPLPLSAVEADAAAVGVDDPFARASPTPPRRSRYSSQGLAARSWLPPKSHSASHGCLRPTQSAPARWCVCFETWRSPKLGLSNSLPRPLAAEAITEPDATRAAALRLVSDGHR